MLAVTREIGQQTAKASGAKSLCDRQMIQGNRIKWRGA
jgi:hypothetical protein